MVVCMSSNVSMGWFGFGGEDRDFLGNFYQVMVYGGSGGIAAGIFTTKGYLTSIPDILLLHNFAHLM